MILGDKYKLSNGVLIPKLGLGTWFISDKDVPLEGATNEWLEPVTEEEYRKLGV